MAGARRNHPPGILSLAQFVDDHESAVSRDLIHAGLRLRDAGSPEFTLDDLAHFIKHSDPDSATYLAAHPPAEDDQWGLSELLLAEAVDTLRIIAWQKTKDGAKGRNQPEPIPRPGVEPTKKKRGGTSTTDIADAPKRYAIGRTKSAA